MSRFDKYVQQETPQEQPAEQPQAAPQPQQEEEAGSILNPFAQGATFGFGDEAAAGLAAMIGTILPESMGGFPEGTSISDAYTNIQQSINDATKAYADREEGAALAAEIAGGFATGGAGIAKTLATLGRGSTTAGRVAIGGATGGVEGGLYGAGTADPGDRVAGAAQGAVPGVIFGTLGTAGFEKISNSLAKRAELARKMRDSAQKSSADLAKFKMNPAGKLRADQASKEAIRQGFGDGIVQLVKTAEPADKKAMLDMIGTARKSMGDARFAANNRINQVIGERLGERIKGLSAIKKQAGAKVDEAAQALKGQDVEYQPAIDNFISELEAMGVKFDFTDGVKVNLSGSDIEGATEAGAILGRVLNRLVNTNVPDAYDVHRAKRFIDSQVEFGKRGERGLTGQTTRVIKNLRRNLDTALDGKFADYDAANTMYADSISALDDLQSALGPSVDMLGESSAKQLGIQSRKLLSNYTSAVNQHDAILGAEEVLRKYGQTPTGNIMDLVTVESALRGVVPQNLFNTFEGNIQKSMQQSMRAAAGDKGVIADVVGSIIQKARGVTPETALDSLENVIKSSGQ